MFAAAVLCAALALANRGLLMQHPLSAQLEFASPSYASPVPGGGLAVVDNSKRRVALLDGQYKVTTVINGGSTSETGFFYAESAVSDSKSIFVSRSAIRAPACGCPVSACSSFPRSGRFERWPVSSVHTTDPGAPMQLGNILSLRADGGRLTFLFPRARHALAL